MKCHIIIIFLLLLQSTVAYAGEADVVAVDVTRLEDKSYQFDVTVSHEDEGWDHYLNKWEIEGENGIIYGSRTLFHPHVGQENFTRSLSGVKIPEKVSHVTIRAHDSIHKYGGKFLTLLLPR